MPMIDLTGKRFGRLTVISRHGTNGLHPAWLCLCDCGKNITTRGDHLRRGETKSCGCLEDECRESGNNSKHNGTRTRLYVIWSGMRKRCTNPKTLPFKNYGGRGVSVCDEWGDFSAFRDWAINNGYADNLSIDRIDNDGNYSPDNCKWSDAKQQASNRRPKSKGA